MVAYGDESAAVTLNRYAVLRLLLPGAVSVPCALLAARQASLAVPLLMLIALEVPTAVVWIILGAPSQR
jgi:hypothetical protein